MERVGGAHDQVGGVGKEQPSRAERAHAVQRECDVQHGEAEDGAVERAELRARRGRVHESLGEAVERHRAHVRAVELQQGGSLRVAPARALGLGVGFGLGLG